MPYRPPYRTQLDDSRCEKANCMCVACLMAMRRDWLGVKLGSPISIRNYHNVYCPGTTVNMNVRAVKALYGTDLEYRWDVPWEGVEDALAANRGVAALMLYRDMHGTPFDASPNFSGHHGIYLNSMFREDGRWWVATADPLASGWGRGIPKGWQDWPRPLVREVMTDALSNGHVEFAFTRSTSSHAQRKVLYIGGRWRHKPDGRDQDAVSRGSIVRVIERKRGPRWSVAGRQGRRWYGIDRINNMSASSAVGDPVIWLPKGLFVGAGGTVS